MAINMKRIIQYVALFSITLVFLFVRTPAHADGGAITISPNSGNYVVGQLFTVTVTIDGGGSPFNAAKASVLVSPALSVENVVLGDCGFAFVKPPVQSDPSFVGVMLGGSSKNCSVYTLTVKAIGAGKGTITFVNSSVKSYKTAVDILTALQNATFTISTVPGSTTSPITPSPIQSPITGTNGTKLYDIVFAISQPQDLPLAGIYVVLDQNLPTQKTAIPTLISGMFQDTASGNVKFENVPQGVHTIATYYNTKQLSKQIVYVAGGNKTLVFGVSTKRSTVNWPWAIGIAALLIILVIIAMVVYKILHKQPNMPSSPQEAAFKPITPQQ